MVYFHITDPHPPWHYFFFFPNTILNFSLLVLRPFIFSRLIFGPPPLTHPVRSKYKTKQNTHTKERWVVRFTFSLIFSFRSIFSLIRAEARFLNHACISQLHVHLLEFSEVPLLEGMCDSDTGGQTSRVVFAHPQILRPELCNHVESWCLWRSCLRVSWFMRNSLAVTVKTESAGDSGLFLWASPLLCAQTDSTHPAHPSPVRPSQREPLQHVVQQVYLFSSLVWVILCENSKQKYLHRFA